MVETGNIMGRNIASGGRSARGAVADFNLLFASGSAKNKNRPLPEEASGLWGVGAGGERRGKCPRQRWKVKAPQAAFIFEVMTETRFEIGAKLSFVSLTTSSLVFEVCATAASNAFLLFSA